MWLSNDFFLLVPFFCQHMVMQNFCLAVLNFRVTFTPLFLIAALIFSAGYYCAPFLQFKEFELYWGAVFF